MVNEELQLQTHDLYVMISVGESWGKHYSIVLLPKKLTNCVT